MAYCSGWRGNKGPWTEEEIMDLRAAILECDGGDLVLAGQESTACDFWSRVSARLGSGRSPWQCHEKFDNDLRDGISKEPWSLQEEYTLALMLSKLGNKWTIITSKYLPGRSANGAKNVWNANSRASRRSTLLWIYADMVVRQGQDHSPELFQRACEAYEEQGGVTPLAEFAVDEESLRLGPSDHLRWASQRAWGASPVDVDVSKWGSSQRAWGATEPPPDFTATITLDRHAKAPLQTVFQCGALRKRSSTELAGSYSSDSSGGGGGCGNNAALEMLLQIAGFETEGRGGDAAAAACLMQQQPQQQLPSPVFSVPPLSAEQQHRLAALTAAASPPGGDGGSMLYGSGLMYAAAAAAAAPSQHMQRCAGLEASDPARSGGFPAERCPSFERPAAAKRVAAPHSSEEEEENCAWPPAKRSALSSEMIAGKAAPGIPRPGAKRRTPLHPVGNNNYNDPIGGDCNNVLPLPGDSITGGGVSGAGGVAGRGINPAEIFQTLNALATDQTVSAQDRSMMMETYVWAMSSVCGVRLNC